MTKLGFSLGEAILNEINSDQVSIYLASTVEDADFLATGILSFLERQLKSIAFASFWNHRFSPFEIEDLQIFPILKKYQEPANGTINYLNVPEIVKSRRAKLVNA
jgi:hypothetical protein